MKLVNDTGQPLRLTFRRGRRGQGSTLQSGQELEFDGMRDDQVRVEGLPLPDFTRLSCNAVVLAGRGDVVAIYGLLGEVMVARGYLAPADAIHFAKDLATCVAALVKEATENICPTKKVGQ